MCSVPLFLPSPSRPSRRRDGKTGGVLSACGLPPSGKAKPGLTPLPPRPPSAKHSFDATTCCECRNGPAVGEDDDSNDNDGGDEGKRAGLVNGKMGSSRVVPGGRSGRTPRSTRSGAGGGMFGSDYGSDDESEFGEEWSAERGMVPGGTSGFGGSTFGASGRSAFGASGGGGGGGRTSRRVFGEARPARSNRARSRTDFGGGGGGAMDMLRQDSSAFVDNAPQLNASGQVIDTGIGVMPALDMARQKAGFASASAASVPVPGGGGGAAGGVFGNTGAGMEVGVGADASTMLGMAAAGAGGGWEDEDDEFSQVPRYLKGREELDQSIGEEKRERGRGGREPAVSADAEDVLLFVVVGSLQVCICRRVWHVGGVTRGFNVSLREGCAFCSVGGWRTARSTRAACSGSCRVSTTAGFGTACCKNLGTSHNR